LLIIGCILLFVAIYEEGNTATKSTFWISEKAATVLAGTERNCYTRTYLGQMRLTRLQNKKCLGVTRTSAYRPISMEVEQ